MSVLNTRLERQSRDGLDMELPDRRKSGKPQRREGGHAAGWSDRGGCQIQGEMKAGDPLWRLLKVAAKRRSFRSVCFIKSVFYVSLVDCVLLFKLTRGLQFIFVLFTLYVAHVKKRQTVATKQNTENKGKEVTQKNRMFKKLELVFSI